MKQKDFLAEEAIGTPEDEIDVRIVLRENAELKEENAFLKEWMAKHTINGLIDSFRINPI